MPPRTRRNAAHAPADLDSKRDATVALAAVQAETRAEQLVDEDGGITVTLRTKLGSADIRVPPYDEWTSVAIRGMNCDDSLLWAQRTLSPTDLGQWAQLDPTVKDTKVFFEEWGRLLGQSLPE